MDTTMKSLRKRPTWILLTLILLPVLVSSVWIWRQVRQQRLDHALIESIKRNDTKSAIALLDQGADANATDKPYQPLLLKSMLSDFWNKVRGIKPAKNQKVYPSALMLPYARFYAGK